MFLLNKNPNKIEWFGHIYSYMHKKTRIQFYQGGAGYVMSKALVKLLVNKGFPKLCRKAPDEFDDREIGMCLNKMMKIYTHETRDLNRKLVFVPGNPEQFATMGPNKKASWYHFNNLVKYPKGKNSLSDYPISFHYVSTDMFYALEYLIYHSNVVGKRQLIFRDNQNENKTEAAAKIIKKMEDYSNKFYVTVEK
uniref:N-acetylgalactosaminide beta-1,3-galactosyltransferase n=1 Tax=Rhabditophanes sp. KR3021 TaxID=114890 RepID=A0AC35THS9_9BILA